MRSTVEKLSISVPRALAGELRRRVGARGVSRFATHAIRRALEKERLTELLAELDDAHGPVPKDMLDDVRRRWPKS